MSLRDTLRKAAGLLVELPPEEPRADASPDAGSAAESSDEMDALLADLERRGAEATPATRTVEEIVRASAGPNLDQVHVPQILQRLGQ